MDGEDADRPTLLRVSANKQFGTLKQNHMLLYHKEPSNGAASFSDQQHLSLPLFATPLENVSPPPEHPGLSRASPPVRTEFCCCPIHLQVY